MQVHNSDSGRIASHASIAGVSYVFPCETRSIGELAAAGKLDSEPGVLEGFGFSRVHVATTESPYDLALQAGTSLLREHSIAPESIDLLIYAGTPSVAYAPAGDGHDAGERVQSSRRFHYPATRLQFDLGLERASAMGVDQLACTTLFSAIRIARAMCVADDVERVLCVSSEFYPAAAGREAIYNCTSDAACAVLVERGGDRNRIVASTHITKGYYWDCDALRNEVVASYFPTSRQTILETLRRADWQPSDVRWVLPHNVSARSWDILIDLLGIPRDRLWSRNIARDGHTLAGDNFINFRDAVDAGCVTAGDRLLLFSYGYGAHWTALAVEA